MQVPNTSAPARRATTPAARSFTPTDVPSGEADADFDWAIEALRAASGASFALILAREPGGVLRFLALNGLPAPRAAALLDTIADRLAGPTPRLHPIEENWLDPGDRDIARLFHITQHPDRAISLVVGFQSPPKGSAMRRVLALGKLLLPCVTRFAAMRDALERERRQSHRLRNALDHVNVGVSIVSPSRQLEFANLALREIVEEHDGLRANGDSITATSLKDAVRLQLSIDHILSANDSDGPGHALMLALPRQPGKRPLMAAVLPSQGAGTSREAPSAILFVIRPEGDLSGALVPICRLNGLSPVETRLACSLTMGKTLAEAARAMRIKQQTARAYLRQIFQKTGTNRQADLVRMMMSNLLPFFDRTKVEAIV